MSRWVGDAIQPSPLLSSPLLLPLIFPSIQVFSNESVLHIRWLKYWSFSFSISPSKKYSGLLSFTIDWFDLLTVQDTLRSLLQHTVQKHQFLSAQPSLWCSSHIHLWLLQKPKLWLFRPLSGKWCLYFSIQSRFVITIPRSKHIFFIEPFNFSFFSISGWGIDLDYYDNEWFALEMNRDHPVIFEIAPKYCISDSC